MQVLSRKNILKLINGIFRPSPARIRSVTSAQRGKSSQFFKRLPAEGAPAEQGEGECGTDESAITLLWKCGGCYRF